MTRNGSGRGYVFVSTDTWRSLIASSRALWARGLLRLISSARTMFANRGPGEKVKLLLSESKMWTPTTSWGSRSLVNWMRRNVPEMLADIARARVVFPVPGMSSRRMCPPARKEAEKAGPPRAAARGDGRDDPVSRRLSGRLGGDAQGRPGGGTVRRRRAGEVGSGARTRPTGLVLPRSAVRTAGG